MQTIIITIFSISTFFLIKALLSRIKMTEQLNDQIQTLTDKLELHKTTAASYKNHIHSISQSANTIHIYAELLLEEDLNPSQKDLVMELLLADETMIHLNKKLNLPLY